jgi:hypothetical protein
LEAWITRKENPFLRKFPKRLGHRSSTKLAVLLECIAALLLAVAPALNAQSQQPSSTLKPELQSLSYFLGQWSCDGEFPSSHKPISSRIVFSPELDGSWLSFRWDDNPPSQFHALELWGFDKTAKHFTNSIYDNFGGARIFHSAGWVADELTWGPRDLPANAPVSSERFVIDRKSTKEFVISWEIVPKSQAQQQQQQQWVVGDRLTCRQQ